MLLAINASEHKKTPCAMVAKRSLPDLFDLNWPHNIKYCQKETKTTTIAIIIPKNLSWTFLYVM